MRNRHLKSARSKRRRRPSSTRTQRLNSRRVAGGRDARMVAAASATIPVRRVIPPRCGRGTSSRKQVENGAQRLPEPNPQNHDTLFPIWLCCARRDRKCRLFVPTVRDQPPRRWREGEIHRIHEWNASAVYDLYDSPGELPRGYDPKGPTVCEIQLA